MFLFFFLEFKEKLHIIKYYRKRKPCKCASFNHVNQHLKNWLYIKNVIKLRFNIIKLLLRNVLIAE